MDNGNIELQYCTTQEYTAEIFKLLNLDKFVKFRDKLGVVSHMTIKGG
jgi:hypothetical protein